MQPSKNQPLVSSSLKENSNSPPQNTPKIEIPKEITDKQDIITNTPIEKEKYAYHNTKTQLEKPFDLEAEIAKLYISIPISELAKHDVYK